MTAGPVPSPATGPAGTLGRPLNVRILGIPIALLLGVQLLLGMALNLYVTLPDHPGVGILVTEPLLLAHAIVGFMILGVTGRAVASSLRGVNRPLLPAALLGILSAVVAFLAGLSFTFDTASAAASYVMSIGFAGVLIAAVLLLAPVRPRRESRDSPAPPVGQGSGSTGGT